MKMMKKIAKFILSVCLIATCFSMIAFAADGKTMFTDPETKVGETVEVKGVVQKEKGNMGKIEITLKYDTEMLKFLEGNGITETESGLLKYTGDATNETGTRKEYVFTFTALKEGTTKIEVTDVVVKDVSGAVKSYTKGSSTIKIAAGEGVTPPSVDTTTTGASVEINGESYVISNTIPESEIPEGYEAATLEYDQVEYNVVYSEEFGLYLVYMLDSELAGEFFMYVEEDATFAPYEEIKVSEDVRIALLSDTTNVVLPEKYETTEVILNGHAFPSWRDTENPDYYVLYAISNSQEGAVLYQLDNAEGTYQRFIQPEVVEEIEKSAVLSKLSALLENHLDYVILGTGLGFLIFLLIIVILSVKLYNRNAELDEIYDEYGLLEDDDKDVNTEDDVMLDLKLQDDDYDDEIDETDVEEDFDEDELDDMTLIIQQGMTELDASAKDDEEDDDEETYEESLGKALQEVVAQQSENDDDDDDDDFLDNFSIDFIDLDD